MHSRPFNLLPLTLVAILLSAAGCEQDSPEGSLAFGAELQLDSSALDTLVEVDTEDYGSPDTTTVDDGGSPPDTRTGADAPNEEDTSVVFMPLSEAGDVVSFVEVARYMGLWYEIATTPSFQQAACSNTQAEYTYNASRGWVDVVNMCTIGGTAGNKQELQGRAEVVDPETQAKLSVTFFGQSAPYWVVALDGSDGPAPYQWAVVSVPGNSVVWLLSRTSQLDPTTREAIENHLANRGFPVETLVDTPHLQP